MFSLSESQSILSEKIVAPLFDTIAEKGLTVTPEMLANKKVCQQLANLLHNVATAYVNIVNADNEFDTLISLRKDNWYPNYLRIYYDNVTHGMFNTVDIRITDEDVYMPRSFHPILRQFVIAYLAEVI